MRSLASSLWDFTQRHPWYPEAVMERPPITPHSMAALEFAFSILDGTPLSVADRAAIIITVSSTVLAAAQNAAAEARTRARLQVTDEEIDDSAGAFFGKILASGRYPRFREAMTSADRLDPQGKCRCRSS